MLYATQFAELTTKWYNTANVWVWVCGYERVCMRVHIWNKWKQAVLASKWPWSSQSWVLCTTSHQCEWYFSGDILCWQVKVQLMNQRGHTPTQPRGNPQQSSNSHALSDEATLPRTKLTPPTSDSTMEREEGRSRWRQRAVRKTTRMEGDSSRKRSCRKAWRTLDVLGRREEDKHKSDGNGKIQEWHN